MDEGIKATREQPLITRVDDLLEQVEKGIYSVRSEIHGINEKLLPATVVRDVSESEKAEKEQPKGWFMQTIVKLEGLRNDLNEIHVEEIKKLKGATGLLGPNVKVGKNAIESKGDEGGC